MTVIEHLALRQYVLRQMSHVDNSLATIDLTACDVAQVFTGHDCLNTRKCQCLVNIDGLDQGVSMRAAQNAAPQHARHYMIGAEGGAACDFVRTIRTNGPCADNFQIFGFIGHGLKPSFLRRHPLPRVRSYHIQCTGRDFPPASTGPRILSGPYCDPTAPWRRR